MIPNNKIRLILHYIKNRRITNDCLVFIHGIGAVDKSLSLVLEINCSVGIISPFIKRLFISATSIAIVDLSFVLKLYMD